MVGIISYLIDLFLHLDTHLVAITSNYGLWVYIILFLVIFLETGLVITPFLPGDSLMFAAGAIASLGALHVTWLMVILTLAAILGDTVNYWIGHAFGKQVLAGRLGRLIRQEHIQKTEMFFKLYGTKTIVLARFVPFVRTIAPFLAGMGRMPYRIFISYNILGGVVWVNIFLILGYLFGDVPFIKENFSWVIIAIIVITLVPVAIEYLRNRAKHNKTIR